MLDLYPATFVPANALMLSDLREATVGFSPEFEHAFMRRSRVVSYSRSATLAMNSFEHVRPEGGDQGVIVGHAAETSPIHFLGKFTSDYALV